LISEKTVEENIWRKQVIKRKLDDMVIDQGGFSREEMRFWHRMARQEGVKGGEGENIFGGAVGGESGEEGEAANMNAANMKGKGKGKKGKESGKGFGKGPDKGLDKGKGKKGKGGKAGSKGGFFFSSVSEETDEMFFGTQVLHGMSDDLMEEAGIGVTVGHSGAPILIAGVDDQKSKTDKLETIPEGTLSSAAGGGEQGGQGGQASTTEPKLTPEELKQLEALKKLEARKKASREMESAMRMLEDADDYEGYREAANEEDFLITGTGEADENKLGDEEGGKDGKDGESELERKMREREEREELRRIAGKGPKGKNVGEKGRKKSDLGRKKSDSGRKKSDEKKKGKSMDVDSGSDIDEDDSAFSSEELMEGSDAERTGKTKTDKVKRTPGNPSILPSIYKANRRTTNRKRKPPMSPLTRKRRLRRVLNTIKNCQNWSKNQHKLWKKRRQNRRLKWLAFLKARKAKNTALGTNNTPLVDYCLGQARRLDLMLSSIKPKAKRKGRKPKKIRGRLAPIPEGSDEFSAAPKLTERQEKLKLLSETFRERTLCITRCRGTFRIDDSLRRSRASSRRTSVDGTRGGGMDTQSNTAYNTALNSVSTPFLTSGKREGKHQFGASSTFASAFGGSSSGNSLGNMNDSGSKGADWARTHLPSFKETESVPFLERTSTGASAKSSKSLGSASSRRNFKSPPAGDAKDAKWLQNSGLKESDGDSGVRKRVRFRDDDSPEADSPSAETGSGGKKEKSKAGKKEKSMRRSSTGSAKNENKSEGGKPKPKARSRRNSASSPDVSEQASSSAASNTNSSSNNSGPASSQNSGHLSLASINSSNISGLSLQSLSSMSLGDRIKLRNRYLGQNSIRNRTRSRTKSRESEEGNGGE